MYNVVVVVSNLEIVGLAPEVVGLAAASYDKYFWKW
jgi:hypothetical protein